MVYQCLKLRRVVQVKQLRLGYSDYRLSLKAAGRKRRFADLPTAFVDFTMPFGELRKRLKQCGLHFVPETPDQIFFVRRQPVNYVAIIFSFSYGALRLHSLLRDIQLAMHEALLSFASSHQTDLFAH